jgi:hypothetical protein
MFRADVRIEDERHLSALPPTDVPTARRNFRLAGLELGPAYGDNGTSSVCGVQFLIEIISFIFHSDRCSLIN